MTTEYVRAVSGYRRFVREVRQATPDDAPLLVSITASGFHEDPAMSWAIPDAAARRTLLPLLFTGLVRDYLPRTPDASTVHVLEQSCAAFWRPPSFSLVRGAGERARDMGEPGSSPFPDDVLERVSVLGATMMGAHPHEPHWYLNVVSTLPERQGQGLGGRVLAPVLAVCDRDAVPAYLESTNPRNMTLYRRNGFEQIGELRLPDGPSVYPMWRDPRPSSESSLP